MARGPQTQDPPASASGALESQAMSPLVSSQSLKETISNFVSFVLKSVQGKQHRKFKEEIKMGEHLNSIPEEGNESRLCTLLETRILHIHETQYYMSYNESLGSDVSYRLRDS